MKKKGVLVILGLVLILFLPFISAFSFSEFFNKLFRGNQILASSPSDVAYWSTSVVRPGDSVKLYAELDNYTTNANIKVFEQDISECGSNTDSPFQVNPSSPIIKNGELHEDNLSLLMRFDKDSYYGENSTFVYDFSGNGNNGIVNNVTWTSSGKYGGAFHFKGCWTCVENITIKDNPKLNPEFGDFSVEAWFKSTTMAHQNILVKGPDGGGGWRLGIGVVSAGDPNGQIEVYLGGQTKNRFDAGMTAGFNGNWHHIAFVISNRNGNNLNLSYYFDGNFIKSEAVTLVNPNITSNDRLFIGSEQQKRLFVGDIDNIMVYKRVLSADEILAHYINGTNKFVAISNWTAEYQDEGDCNPPEYYFTADMNGKQYKSNLLIVNNNCFDNDNDNYYGNTTLCRQGNDCNDGNKNINLDAIEVCDGIDNNCDGLTDIENSQGCQYYYKDNDRDGYGLVSDKKCLCSASFPYDSSNLEDCEDNNAGIKPGVVDYCGNNIDENCNGGDLVCGLGNAKWGVSSALAGQKVGLTVLASNLSKNIIFKAYEKDDNECGDNQDDNSSINPASVTPFSYLGIPAEDATSLYFKFDKNSSFGENNTFAYDFSGNGNNGIVNNVTWTSSGKYGGAFHFKGCWTCVEKITVEDNPKLNPELGDFSVEAWFKSTTMAHQNILVKGPDCGGGWRLGIGVVSVGDPNGQIEVYLGGQTKNRFDAGMTAGFNGNWHHIAFVISNRNGNNLNLSYYFDGNFIKSEAVTLVNPNITSNDRLFIGSEQQKRLFVGDLDNIMVYKRVLSADEILAHYQNKRIEAISNWTTESQDEGACNPPEYYFTAEIDGEPGQIVRSGLLSVGQGYGLTLNLNSGWNLISTPYTLSQNINQIFVAELQGVWEYSGNYRQLGNTEILAPGKAYWVLLSSAKSVTLSGSNTPVNINLVSGWNLIGVNETKLLSSISGAQGAWDYNGNYNPATSLEKGKGYWVLK